MTTQTAAQLANLIFANTISACKGGTIGNRRVFTCDTTYLIDHMTHEELLAYVVSRRDLASLL